MTRLFFPVLGIIALVNYSGLVAAPSSGKEAGWDMVKTEQLKGVTVGLSRPVLVARSKGFLWFPTLMPLAHGELLAMLNNYADEVVTQPTAGVCWSGDGGLTWSAPRPVLYGDSNFRLASGDRLILPYILNPRPDNALAGPYQICPKGKRELRLVKEGLRVTGLPRPDQPHPKRGVSAFVFNGSGIQLKDGSYLASLYGNFKDAKRGSLLMAASEDGIHWTVRATVADEKCKLEGADGPSEAATCRVKDGRLMCIFRLGAGSPYGQTFSNDEGRTWTEPVAVKGAFSVQPCLAVLKDGTIVLSGGRPGLFAWINTDGTGMDWQRVDLRANHNAAYPKDAIAKITTDGHSNTTAYTRIVATADNQLLCIYDRVPHGWHGIPEASAETNSVWVVRLVVEKK